MKKVILAVFVAGLMLVGLDNAYATTFTFQPEPVDLEELAHWRYYAWQIEFTSPIPAGETVTGATLTLNNVDNWAGETYVDHLYIRLLDDTDITGGTALGSNTRWYSDSDNGEVDNWSPLGVLIDDYSDPQDGGSSNNANSTSPTTLIYNFDETLLNALETYASSDGKFGFGFDPDCHYFNTGIEFTVNTAPIPEPATLMLLGLGLVGVLGLRRRRVKL